MIILQKKRNCKQNNAANYFVSMKKYILLKFEDIIGAERKPEAFLNRFAKSRSDKRPGVETG